MDEILTTVNKKDVEAVKQEMMNYLRKANNVCIYSTYRELNYAMLILNKAMGMCEVLEGLKIPLDHLEDIKRIQQKITDLLQEKRRIQNKK